MSVARTLSPGLSRIARQVGLPVEVVEYCCEVGLVQQPVSEIDLAELRRIRRLQMLEVNLPGIEIILHMRRRMLALQAEMEAMAAKMAEIEARFERELREVERRFAVDG